MKLLTTVSVVVGLIVLAVIVIKIIGWLLGSFLWLVIVAAVGFVAYRVGQASTREP